MSSDERTPRSGRAKKKSALSKFAAKNRRRSNDSTEGSSASLQRDSDDDGRPARHYPIDARVEVNHRTALAGAIEDDSDDEGIEMNNSSSYDYRRNRINHSSESTVDRMRELNMRNDNKNDRLTPHHLHKGEKRFHEQSSSGDERKTRTKSKKFPSYMSKASTSDTEYDSDRSKEKRELTREYQRLQNESDSESEESRPRNRYKSKESLSTSSHTSSSKTYHRNNLDSDDDSRWRKPHKSPDSDDESQSSKPHVNSGARNRIIVSEAPTNQTLNKSRPIHESFKAYSSENLVNRYEDMLAVNDSFRGRVPALDAKERAEMNDSMPDLRTYRRFPEPGLSSSPMPTGVGRAAIFNSFERSATFDVMSQRSFQSTSVLPQISTKEVKARSFLVGSINSRSSLLGAEEMERYFPERKMRVFMGTWNMMEMKEVPESLDEFLLPESCDYVQDIYVIATQESHSNRREWEVKLQETLGPQHVLFHSAAFGVLYLSVFIRRDLIWFCSVAEEDSISTRAGPSNIKTKGAVAISFTFFGTSLLFINSHFTPHDGKVKERVADYQKICKGLKLPRQASNKPQYVASNDDVTSRYDCVFWAGDLNFRIERQRDHVDSAVQGITSQEFPDYDELITHDELWKARNEGLAFQDFQEGRISFKPTYKFDPGTDHYDTSKKMRIPSYTDRVLYRNRKKNSTVCLHYDCITDIKCSDHRPVYAMFEVNIRPGRDNVPLAAGQFNREVWLEGNHRRSLKHDLRNRTQKASSVCSVQ